MNHRRIQQAFGRTAPHPLDARVRLARSADDLAAIHAPEAAAVIWQRGENYKVLEALDRMSQPDSYLHKEDRPTLYMPSIYSGPLGTLTFGSLEYGEPKWEWGLPKAIRQDIVSLHKAFKQASRGFLRTSWKDTLRNETPIESANHYMPHIDQNRPGGSIDVRLVATYSLNPYMTTEWYPGIYSPAEVSALECPVSKDSGVLKNAPRALEAFKDSLGRQRLAPGEVLLVKGLYYVDARPRPDKECLVHSTPVPRDNDVRLIYVATHGKRSFL